jgi:hypothetical protein
MSNGCVVKIAVIKMSSEKNGSRKKWQFSQGRQKEQGTNCKAAIAIFNTDIFPLMTNHMCIASTDGCTERSGPPEVVFNNI